MSARVSVAINRSGAVCGEWTMVATVQARRAAVGRARGHVHAGRSGEGRRGRALHRRAARDDAGEPLSVRAATSRTACAFGQYARQIAAGLLEQLEARMSAPEADSAPEHS